jgi:AcrR family transcriptional regulator
MDRADALQAALGVFLQYGYRKSSMEDIARAVGVSRQWIYQQFTSKTDLLREVVEHGLDAMLEGGTAALAERSDDLEAQLVRAFDGWCGAYVQMLNAPHAAEIMEAAGSKFGRQIQACHDGFEAALARFLKKAGIKKLPGSVEPADIAAMLVAASDGVKKGNPSREEYLAQMRRFIRVVLAAFDQ